MSKRSGMKAMTLAMTMFCLVGMTPGMTYAQAPTAIGSTAELAKAGNAFHLNVTQATMQAGTNLKLSVQRKANNVKNVKWKSLNTNIATVNKNGRVTAKKNGNVKIQAIVQNQTLVCKITVKQQKVQSIKMDKTLLLASGDEDVLMPTCRPASAAVGKKITWKSDDPSIVTAAKGHIEAKDAGITTVHASIDGKKASCQIGVLDDFAIDEEESLELSLENDQNYQLGLMFNGEKDPEEWEDFIENAGMEIEWESDDEDVVEVDVDGCLVLNDAGEATITATFGDFQAECLVSVIDDTDDDEDTDNDWDDGDDDEDDDWGYDEDSDEEDSEDEDVEDDWTEEDEE